MSNFLAIATVTETFRQMLNDSVKDDVNGAVATAVRPSTSTTGPGGLPEVGANIYLYQVSPNGAWRNTDLPTRRQNGHVIQRPRAALDLHYLLSFYGSESQMEPQRVLGSVVRTIHTEPVLTRDRIRQVKEDAVDSDDDSDSVPNHYLALSDLADEVELVKFTAIPFSLEELSKLWSVFLQVPYTLSITYQASVVFIEGAVTPRPALPVREHNVHVMSFRQPVIEQVISQAGADQPIIVDSTLLIHGRQLRGDVIKVRISGVVVPPQEASDAQIRLQLSSLPAGSLRAGVQAVQVIHELNLGTPADPHRGFESNVAAFVLRPTITNVSASDSTGVTVKFTPTVGRTQRVVLLLNELSPPSNRSAYAYSFKAPSDNGIENEEVDETDSITFPITNVEPEDYLIRVQVDGAESPLDMDPSTKEYIQPKVTIP